MNDSKFISDYLITRCKMKISQCTYVRVCTFMFLRMYKCVCVCVCVSVKYKKQRDRSSNIGYFIWTLVCFRPLCLTRSFLFFKQKNEFFTLIIRLYAYAVHSNWNTSRSRLCISFYISLLHFFLGITSFDYLLTTFKAKTKKKKKKHEKPSIRLKKLTKE